MKLLIADDQQSLHTFLDKMMDWKALGITEIRHAYDGEETAELAEQFRPELMIVDIQMPYLNGIQVLKRLQELSFKPKTVILSAYDEFEYAREALRLSVSQYLLKPVDTAQLEAALQELTAAVRKECGKSLETAVARLLQQEQAGPEQIASVQQAFQILGIEQYLVLYAEGMSLEPETWKQALQDGLPEVNPVVCRASNQEYVMILGLPLDAEQETLLQLCAQAFMQGAGHGSRAAGKITIGASGPGDGADQLELLLLQSKQAAEAGFYHEEPVTLFDGEKHRVSDSWMIQHYQRFDQAFEEKIMLSFSTDALTLLVRELFDEFARLHLAPEMAAGLCHYYLHLAEQLLKRSKRVTADYETVRLDLLRQYRKASELEGFVCERLKQLLEHAEDAVGLTEDTIERIKAHVELHYAEDLSLQTVADAFGVDKYQLSRLYKQRYGINYWQFVTQVRMEKALELLGGTNLKNSVIAERIGFVDESHFSKSFKKHFGLSPKDYRAGKQMPPTM